MLIGSWWRLEWYIVHSGKIPQISPTFGKIPRKFPEKFGNLVKISGIQSKFREFSQDFGNLVKISGIWMEYSSGFHENSSDLNIPVNHWNTTEFVNLLKLCDNLLQLPISGLSNIITHSQTRQQCRHATTPSSLRTARSEWVRRRREGLG